MLRTRQSVKYSICFCAENIYSAILMPRSNVSSISRLQLDLWLSGESTDAMLVPKEPLVSISPIFLSDEVSHNITLPSCVVVFKVLPSGDNDSAHASPTTLRAFPSDKSNMI